jgi:membrane-associated PAP2 superfamily phosphatase
MNETITNIDWQGILLESAAFAMKGPLLVILVLMIIIGIGCVWLMTQSYNLEHKVSAKIWSVMTHAIVFLGVCGTLIIIDIGDKQGVIQAFIGGIV